MTLFNPVHGLVAPLLCVFTIPLAIFAGITTTLAFSVLMFRVAVVYLDIALAFIPHYLSSGSPPRILAAREQQHRLSRDVPMTPVSPLSSRSGHSTPSPTVSPHPLGGGYTAAGYYTPRRRRCSYGFGAAPRRSRRSSQVSLASVGSMTHIHEDDDDLRASIAAGPGLTPSVGVGRDFEGIGGWRLDDDQDDSGDWASINSRLELPLERASILHHQRPQSLEPMTPTGGTWLLSIPPQADRSPDERSGNRGGSRSPAKLLPSPSSSRRLNQMIQLRSALAGLDGDSMHFPDPASPRTWRKLNP